MKIAVRKSKAAEMLDLPVNEFERLVANGALPPSITLCGNERWRVRDLEAILNGKAVEDDEDDFEV